MEYLLSILAVVFGLGLMVFVHEWGHFVMARWFGVRVDVFSFGFGPRLWGVRRGPTDYRLSALPLGGYVKMAGDNPAEERQGAPDEFLSKPRWQRVLIAVAGPVMNLLMAVLLTAGLLMYGTSQPVNLDKPVVVAGVLRDSPAAKSGFQAGDRVIEFNGIENPTWDRVRLELLFGKPGGSFAVLVDREGQPISLSARALPDAYSAIGFPAEPVVVGTVTSGLPAERSGLRPGDQIVEFDAQPVVSPFQLSQLIQQTAGRPAMLQVLRGDHPLRLEVRPIKGDPGDGRVRWEIGIGFRFAMVERRYGPVAAASRALWWNGLLTKQIVYLIGDLVRGAVSLKQVEGPLGIARESTRAARRGALDLISLMAIISLNLGILNLLPIPILDGGHVLMLAIEGSLRRDLSLTFKERYVTVGLIFLLVLFVVITYNDVLKLIPGR